MAETIENLVETKATSKLKMYEHVTKNFQQFFDQEDLGALIDRKADIEIVRRMNDKKANNCDIEGIYNLIEQLGKRLKEVSVI